MMKGIGSVLRRRCDYGGFKDWRDLRGSGLD